MKKSLIALAVLAASGAAMAQSSVQVYGLVDVYFASTHNTNAAGVKTSNTVLESGGVNTSRIGFKGTEDLGGGLKAIFGIETGISVDAPAATTLGNREAFVGLAGGFGEVKVGRVWTAYDDVSGASNTLWDSALAPTSGVFQSTGYNANPNNGVKYTTPSYAGFTGAVSYSLDEKLAATPPTAAGAQVTAYSVQYANGPIAAQLAYQTEEAYGVAGSDDFLRLGGSYDFGVVVAKASYGTVDYKTGNEVSEYHLGVDVPVSPALTLSVGYASSTTDNAAGVKQSKRTGFGVGAAYTLSKRTFVYTGLNRNTEKDAAGVQTNKDTVYAVGIQHKF